ncbi:MAG: hypothetical protein RMK89_09960 [Armatimonadota bacterium]|nr:hypothetical protein [Armatimonadota bacterium]MDW8143772.1 hypothetical protein [Armatimonadota bacterium]
MWKPQTKEAVLREVRIREWRKRVGRTIVSALKWLFLISLEGVAVTLGWLKWQSAKIAHDIEWNRLLSQRYDKLLRLGETVYAMYRSGETSWQAIEPLCQEIERIDHQLSETKATPLQVLPYEPEGEQTLPLSASSSQ